MSLMPIIQKKLNMDSIRLKTKELLTYYYGCYGNLVTIATRYVPMLIIPYKHRAKYEVNTTKDKGVTK